MATFADGAGGTTVVTWLLVPLMVVLQLYALLYLAYLWAPAGAALSTLRRRRSGQNGGSGRERNFAVLISAHNEETVIGSLLWSLALQQYPEERRRVYVVANNCTDSTAAVVRGSGLAVCHERTEGGLDTKGAALAWLWDRIAQEAEDCDAVVVLDADNLVAPDFLGEINRTFDRGYPVVQGARCAKNASDSWASQLDAISEVLWHRLDQVGRMRLGLSAILSGSGMAFDRSVFRWLVEEGLKGLLEDVEWQSRLMLAGIKVGYAEQARVYDEKTTRFDQLSRQRKRWMAGIAVAGRHYGMQLLLSGLRSRDIHRLVAGFGATKPPRSVLVALMASMALGGGLFPGSPALLPWPFWVGAIASFGVYVILGMALDRARPGAYLALAYAPAFALLMIVAAIAGTLRPSRQRWVPTTHERGIGIDQLR